MINSDLRELGDRSVFLPIQSSKLDELSAFGSWSPPAADAAGSLQDLRDEVDSAQGLVIHT